ncbi:MAG: tetratricopeptide repeat protein [Terriglobia bacterium]
MWSRHQTLNKPGLISFLICQPNSRLAALSSLLFFTALSVLGHTSPPESVTIPCATAELKQGLVVESAAKNSEGDKAGLGEGDVILSWTRGDVKGEIESPFDLSEIEIEQEPQGRVTLEGTRGGLKQEWVMGPDNWGIQARPSLPPTLLAVYREGQELAKAGKLSETAERWRAGAAEGEKYQCSWLSPWFLFHAAEVLANARQWKDSNALYQQAIRQAAGASSEVRAQLMQALAGVLEQQSDSANAEKYQQEALKEIQRPGPERLATAAGLDNLGKVADDRGDLAKAQEYFRQALAINEKLAPGSLAVAKSLHGLGSVADERGDLIKADEYNSQALEIRKKVAPGSLTVAESLNNLGEVADDRGDLAEAEEYYRKALEIRKRLAPDSLAVEGSLINLGNIADDRGDPAKAEDYYRQTLEIGKKLAPGSLAVAASLNNLGLVANEFKDLAKAEEYYRQSLEIRKILAPGSLDVGGEPEQPCHGYV